MTIDGIKKIRANSTPVTLAEKSAIEGRADKALENVKPKSVPLLYRAVRLITSTLNTLTKSERKGGRKLVSDVEIAKQAHKLFFHNADYKDKIAKLPAIDRREFNGLVYSLVNNSEITVDQVKRVVNVYLDTDRSDEFLFDEDNLSADKDGFPKQKQRDLCNAYLDMRLSTPAMIAFGVARGKVPEELATALVRAYEGVIVTGKVVLTTLALAGVVAAAIATAIGVFGVAIVFAPFIMPAIIGLSVVSGLIFAAYTARGVFEAHSQNAIDSIIDNNESLFKKDDLETRKEAREAAKIAQKDLTKASEWVFEIIFFLKAAKPVAVKINSTSR